MKANNYGIILAEKEKEGLAFDMFCFCFFFSLFFCLFAFIVWFEREDFSGNSFL